MPAAIKCTHCEQATNRLPAKPQAEHDCIEFQLVNNARPIKCACSCSEDVRKILRDRLPLAKPCIIHEYTHYMILCTECLNTTRSLHHWWCPEMKESAHGKWKKTELSNTTS